MDSAGTLRIIPVIKAELMELDLDQVKACIERMSWGDKHTLCWHMMDVMGLYPVVTLDATTIHEDMTEGSEDPDDFPSLEQIVDACRQVADMDWSNEYSAARAEVDSLLNVGDDVTPEVTQANHDEA